MKGFGEKNQSKQIKKQKNEEILNIDKLIKKAFKLQGQGKKLEAAKYYAYLIKKGIKELLIARKYYCTGSIGDLFLLKANECLHKAGIPDEGYLTELIMLQLNPSFNWKISRKLYKRQYKIGW